MKNERKKHYAQQSVYLIASSSLLTNIPAEYSICVLFTKLVAQTRNKPYTTRCASLSETANQ